MYSVEKNTKSSANSKSTQIHAYSYREVVYGIWYTVLHVYIYAIFLKSRDMAVNLFISHTALNVPGVSSQQKYDNCFDSDSINENSITQLSDNYETSSQTKENVNSHKKLCTVLSSSRVSIEENTQTTVYDSLTPEVASSCLVFDCNNHQIEEETKCNEITSDELAALLNNNEALLLIDCRSFIDFNINHIHKAININCTNRITKKRLADGKVTIEEAISCQDGKEVYRSVGQDAAIILYDEKTCDMEGLQSMHPLKLVTECLAKTGKRSKYLKGGLLKFQEDCSALCTARDQVTVPLLFSPTSPEINCDIDSAVASEIYPYLFIGNERDASNRECLNTLGITHVINVTSHLPLTFENDGIIYKRLPATDSGRQNLKQYFNDAIAFIDGVRECGGKVLVHCQAGVSRSPTIVIAYLLARTHHTVLTDAFDFVKQHRSIVAPNLNFMGQLLEFEQTNVVKKGLCPPPQALHLQ